MASARVTEADPISAWQGLESDPDAVLVDVRTRAEWSFVGAPDLSGIGKQVILTEWRRFPTMEVNGGFSDELLAHLGTPPQRVYFICRSGGRSLEAARDFATRLPESAECVNVVEGFEGDLDQDGHRARLNGWKARGLAWRQS